MDKLQWDDSLNINVLDLDEKMQHFFSVLNRFFEFQSIKKKKEEDYDAILEVFADLAEYVNFHFKHEEMILSQHFYPEYKQHQKEHQRFVKRMLGYRRLFSDEPEKAYNDAVKYSREWIMNHVKQDDVRYAPFVRVQKHLNDHKVPRKKR